jgi:hypothetical protein
VFKNNTDVQVLGRPAVSALGIGTLPWCRGSSLGRAGLLCWRRAWCSFNGFVVVVCVVFQQIWVFLLRVLVGQSGRMFDSQMYLHWSDIQYPAS